ncbi:alpha/beta fold hydrolase [Puniceibacterium sediminis]|uniref:Pimeloyl-ACP methyl ester carboxylesterase n=1 Tax=Puniceibacterium sediminis TaxID=1608407 RepID=A0A238WKC2_9RHOB|nr:alpha/beta hydrolase [Puniceibacterium sediminis]SNR47010.1 Pimeloyl-ACP methyl ester carboxylesterase [Puniceibacterium sediminis]
MPYDTRAGFPVHWNEFGVGPEPALMLHPALAHSGAWIRMAGGLADRLRVAAPDMPGHGLSGDWDKRSDYHDQMTEIAASFLEPGMHVIGHSFGATVALRLALENPGMRSLTLIEPVLFAAAKDSAPAAFNAHLKKSRPFANALAVGDQDTAARLFSALWGDGRGWEDLNQKQKDSLIKRIPIIAETNKTLHDDSVGLLAEGRLEALDMPVLLVRGSETQLIMQDIHAALAARIPDVREVVIEGAGHMAPISHPVEVEAAIRAMIG